MRCSPSRSPPAILTITPGVDTAMVLRAAGGQGPRAGAAAGLGVCAGLFVWGAAAAFGLGALLAASSAAFAALKWIGAAYLVFLGLQLMLRPRTQWSAGLGGAGSLGAAFRRGFLTNVLNPKVGVFYATFLPQFIPAGVNVAAFSLLAGGRACDADAGLVFRSDCARPFRSAGGLASLA